MTTNIQWAENCWTIFDLEKNIGENKNGLSGKWLSLMQLFLLMKQDSSTLNEIKAS